MVFDIIGDIHGHAAKLVELLGILGYRERNHVFTHPDTDRTALFVGDYIDRGPEIVRTLEIVRGMVERGSARAVLGNHEYNALCFHTRWPGEHHRWLRPRTDKNIHQHLETLYQFRRLRTLLLDYLAWFLTLPVYLDLGPIRVVHAAWDEEAMAVVGRYSPGGRRMTRHLLIESARRGTEAYQAIETLLKGVEVELPAGEVYHDKDGNPRTRSRVAWWLEGQGRSYGEMQFPERSEDRAQVAVSESDARRLTGYRDEIPVFFGHYWLNSESAAVQTRYICCLDYSIARGGALAAYTWTGEKELQNDRFTLVQSE
ncbi:metallophosphoesterase [Salinispira pacifica]